MLVTFFYIYICTIVHGYTSNRVWIWTLKIYVFVYMNTCIYTCQTKWQVAEFITRDIITLYILVFIYLLILCFFKPKSITMQYFCLLAYIFNMLFEQICTFIIIIWQHYVLHNVHNSLIRIYMCLGIYYIFYLWINTQCIYMFAFSYGIMKDRDKNQKPGIHNVVL